MTVEAILMWVVVYSAIAFIVWGIIIDTRVTRHHPKGEIKNFGETGFDVLKVTIPKALLWPVITIPKALLWPVTFVWGLLAELKRFGINIHKWLITER